MIDPILFTINLGSIQLSVHWYGVLVVAGILVGRWVAAREMRRRGGDPDVLWDGLVWAIPAGILGARLWYVVSDIAGGGSIYLQDPVRILNITEGGLHFYGAVLAGGLAFYLFARRHQLDFLLVLDSAAPALLIGQAVARLANYINQELYGPPTTLPWGIPISAHHRIPPWNDLGRFPLDTTRFHPAFAYDMLWNVVATGILIWVGIRLAGKLKPGSAFAGWLILAGLGRVVLDTWRPDQLRLPGTELSYSRLVAAAMTLVGVLILLAKYRVLRLPFLTPGPGAYRIAPKEKSAVVDEAQEPPASRED